MAEFGSRQHQDNLRVALEAKKGRPVEPSPVITMRIALKARKHNQPIKLTRTRYTRVGLEIATVMLNRLILADALSRLSGVHAAVIHLLYDRDKSKEDAAGILSVSVRTLERREKEALERMADIALDEWARPSSTTRER